MNNKIVSLGFLVAGIVLLIYSNNASESVSSAFSRFFNGTPTDQTTWLLIGGVVATAIGLGGLLTNWRSTN